MDALSGSLPSSAGPETVVQSMLELINRRRVGMRRTVPELSAVVISSMRHGSEFSAHCSAVTDADGQDRGLVGVEGHGHGRGGGLPADDFRGPPETAFDLPDGRFQAGCSDLTG